MITVVLLKPETPGNIGFIARAMANFELEKLIIIEPLCNHLEDDALKKSMHAKSILKKAKVMPYSYLADMKKDFDIIAGTTSLMGDDYNIPRIPMIPEDFAKKISSEKIAVIFGNEGTGLNNEEIKKCDFIISIPSSKKYPALNISHAASIIFYELFKKSGKENITSHVKPATSKEKEVILARLNNILDSLEFSTKEKKENQRIAWKRLFEKSMISKREAFTVIGLLKKIEEKLK